MEILEESFSSKYQKDYGKYINSPEWREKRKQRLKIDGKECRTCCSKTDLEVHHRHYNNFGNEDIKNDLITLCRDCHEAITSSIRFRRYIKQGVKLQSTQFESDREIIENIKKEVQIEKTNLKSGRKVPTKNREKVKLVPTNFNNR